MNRSTLPASPAWQIAAMLLSALRITVAAVTLRIVVSVPVGAMLLAKCPPAGGTAADCWWPRRRRWTQPTPTPSAAAIPNVARHEQRSELWTFTLV